MTILNENYMLVKLQVNTWQANKTDKDASIKHNATQGAASNASRVVKNLLAGTDAKLKATQSAYNAIRLWFYGATAPWGSSDSRSGTRLMATANVMDFLGEFARKKVAAEAVLAEFLDGYQDAIHSAAMTLGALYRQDEYPPTSEVRAAFAAVLEVDPIPEGVDFAKVSMPGAVVKALSDRYEQRTQTRLQAASEDIQARIMKEVERMSVQLSKIAAGEKTRVYDSLTENLRGLVGLARSFGPLDAELSSLADKAQELVIHPAEAYKGNAALAQATADKAAALMHNPATVELEDTDVDDLFSFGEGV